MSRAMPTTNHRSRVIRPARALVALLIGGIALAATTVCAATPDGAGPLPSWRDGAVKQAILTYVAAATDAKSPGFVPPAERIAVFDGDGTLWPERPVPVQVAFAVDRVRALAPERPEWKINEPYRTLLTGDLSSVLAGGPSVVHKMVAGTFSGLTTDEFTRRVDEWLAAARHPRFARPYPEVVYQPMLELLALLRASGFQTYLAASGGVDFLRPWSQRAVGIAPGQVLGGAVVMRYEERDGVPVLIREAKVDFFDDGGARPLAVQRVVGMRPAVAFGNSDRDVELLAWTASRPGPSLVGLVRHTDDEREWAYDRGDAIGRLERGLDLAQEKGWLVVDMKRDWQRVFPFDG